MACYCLANSAFWRLVSWSLLFGTDICDSFLSDSEQTVLIFALCHLKVNQMSLLTFSQISVCMLPLMKINQIRIYLWDYQETGGERMPSFSYLNVNWSAEQTIFTHMTLSQQCHCCCSLRNCCHCSPQNSYVTPNPQPISHLIPCCRTSSLIYVVFQEKREQDWSISSCSLSLA